jgi:hypothetical protein
MKNERLPHLCRTDAGFTSDLPLLSSPFVESRHPTCPLRASGSGKGSASSASVGSTSNLSLAFSVPHSSRTLPRHPTCPLLSPPSYIRPVPVTLALLSSPFVESRHPKSRHPTCPLRASGSGKGSASSASVGSTSNLSPAFSPYIRPVPCFTVPYSYIRPVPVTLGAVTLCLDIRPVPVASPTCPRCIPASLGAPVALGELVENLQD